ncbi:MAG: hypothetical protein H7Y20_04240 [Bryobacteraceae bacterium]|nr:hypothetical protein [Bryobacteraceae bacterium]
MLSGYSVWRPGGAIFLASVSLIAQSTQTPPATADLTSPALRAHASLLRYFRAGPSLAQDLADARTGAAQKNIVWKGLSFFVNDAENLGGLTPAFARETYSKLTCKADAVVIGQTQQSVSHISDWGTVYTDYVFAITAILKDNARSLIRQKATLILTRPGGSAMLGGDPVSSSYRGFPELKQGAIYLQFLHYIPESSAYETYDAYSTLIATGQEWVVARQGSAVALPGLNRGVLETTINEWLRSCRN